MTDSAFFEILKILAAERLPSHDELASLAEEVSTLLENERTDYRPVATDGSSGSLVDFHLSGFPVVVIPDLHARPYFLANILKWKLPGDLWERDGLEAGVGGESGGEACGLADEGSGEFGGAAGAVSENLTVFEALQKNLIQLVFLGDALHTEKNTRDRWEKALEEFWRGDYSGPSISAEMTEGLALLAGLYKLKILFPKNFHFLKGNHENILNENGNGDYGFRKYAEEGEQVRAFISNYYGDDILYLIHCVEAALPLVFAGPKCLVSHAEPKRVYSLEEIIDAKCSLKVFPGDFFWTGNDEAKDGSAIGIIKNIWAGIGNVVSVGGVSEDSASMAVTGGESGEPTGQSFDFGQIVYLGGHRPVQGAFALRQGGTFIQIHNPLRQNIALVRPNRKFDPEKDIFSVIE